MPDNAERFFFRLLLVHNAIGIQVPTFLPRSMLYSWPLTPPEQRALQRTGASYPQEKQKEKRKKEKAFVQPSERILIQKQVNEVGCSHGKILRQLQAGTPHEQTEFGENLFHFLT